MMIIGIGIPISQNNKERIFIPFLLGAFCSFAVLNQATAGIPH
jgi:hypothetical protein